MFWLECIEIFTFFIWKYPEGYAGCAKKNRRDESAVFFSGAYRFTDCAILWYVCRIPRIATLYAIIFSGKAIPT